MKKYLLLFILVLLFFAAQAQKREIYFGLRPEFGFTGVDKYASMAGAGIGGQLSYWLNDKFILITNTGLNIFRNSVNAEKHKVPQNYYIIPLLTGIEYNLSKDIFTQAQLGYSFAKNVIQVSDNKDLMRQVNNALTYSLAFGVRLSPHSDILIKVNHSRFNTTKRTTYVNNNYLGFAYAYNF